MHGGQYVTLDPGDWIEVELEIEAVGEGEVEIGHHLQFPRNRPYQERVTLPGGKTLHWRYSFAPDTSVPDLDARSTVTLRSGTGLELHFKTARMTVHRSGTPAGIGLHVERLEVE